MQDLLTLAKALSDPNRIRALCALRIRELCVCEIIALLALAPSTVSKHMTVLAQAGLVRGRKQGRWMYYSLARQDAPPVVRRALDWTWTGARTECASMREAVRALSVCVKP